MNLEELKRKMDEEHYIYDDTLSTVLYVALQLGRPLLIEGAAGVGKTEVAKVMAAALDRELVRLQCYYEKKEQHQFKDYRTLDRDFQLRLQATYPRSFERQPMLVCAQQLLSLFLKQHSDNHLWEIDSRLLDILKV